MKTTKVVPFFVFFLFVLVSISFAQDSNVQIQKSEDRTGAVVTTPKTARKQVSGNPVDRLFSVFENGIMGIAAPASHWSGKAVDGVVFGVEKTGTVLFSRFFHLVDLKGKWTSSKKTTS